MRNGSDQVFDSKGKVSTFSLTPVYLHAESRAAIVAQSYYHPKTLTASFLAFTIWLPMIRFVRKSSIKRGRVD